MKRIYGAVLALVLAVLLLAGCGAKAPDGMDKSRLETAAKQLVDAANARDWRQFTELFPAGKLKADAWEEQLGPYLDAFGPFVAYKSTDYAAAEAASSSEVTGRADESLPEMTSELAYVLLKAEYENETVTWRVVFSTDYEVVGLWV